MLVELAAAHWLRCAAAMRSPTHTVTTALGCASHGCSLLLLPRFPDSRLRAALRLLAALRPAMRPPSRHPHLVFVCVYVFTHIIHACDFIACVSLSIYSNKLITYAGTGIDQKASREMQTGRVWRGHEKRSKALYVGPQSIVAIN